jgi:hypothetical protein
MLSQLEFDHAAGRGAAGKHRDDRTHDVNGNRINAAVCHFCNAMKASRRYSWQGNQYLPVSKETA